MKMEVQIPILAATLLLLFSAPAYPSYVSRMPGRQPVMHGSTGVSLNFNRSNDPYSSQPAMEGNLYGTYCLELYGMAFPFSFSISREMQTYSHPFTRFGIDPSFGPVRIHLGASRMQLPGASSGGMDFKGIGMELTPGKLRLAGFYGQMAEEGNYNFTGPETGRMSYSGKAFGIKAGWGNSENYIDVSGFERKTGNRATDTLGWNLRGRKQMAAMDFGFMLMKTLNVSGGMSIFRTMKNNAGWEAESVFSFLSKQGRMNLNTNLLYRTEDELAEITGGLDAMMFADQSMISTFVNIYRMAYHDPAMDMSFMNSGLSASLAYSSLGGGKPVNMSLSASYDRFSQSFGSSSYINTSLTAGSSFLKSRALSLSGTAGYCLISNDGSDSRNDILLSVNLGYQVNTSTFSFFVNYNMTPRDRVFLMNEYILKKQTTYRMIAGISYSSSF